MGFFSRQYQPPKTDGMDAATLLMRARAAGDPRDAHAYLTRAEALAPMICACSVSCSCAAICICATRAMCPSM